VEARRTSGEESYLHLVGGADLGGAPDAGEIDEEELLREGEILLQQAEAPERVRRTRHQGVVSVEADGVNGIRRQHEGHTVGSTADRVQLHLARAAAQHLVESGGDRTLAVQKDTHDGWPQLGKRDVSERAQAQPDAAPRTEVTRATERIRRDRT